MILYKGNPLVIGKHFIYNETLLEYQGKLFGGCFEFTSEDNVSYVLTEADLISLKEYSVDEQEGLKEYIKDFTTDVASLQPLTEDKYPSLLSLLQDCKSKLDNSSLVFKGDPSNIELDKGSFGDFFINYIRDCSLNLDSIHLQDFYSQIVSCIDFLSSL
jgi:hypothetical protein